MDLKIFKGFGFKSFFKDLTPTLVHRTGYVLSKKILIYIYISYVYKCFLKCILTVTVDIYSNNKGLITIPLASLTSHCMYTQSCKCAADIVEKI